MFPLSAPRSVVSALSLGLVFLSAGGGYAQGYPNKPIRIITGEPGGASELGARIFGPPLAKNLGQSVVIENRPSVISIEIVAKGVPDGYTLVLAPTNLWIDPLLRSTPWDAIRDFTPISLTNGSPNIVVVHPSLPVNSMKELIALAKAKPGTINYGSSGSGTSTHLAGELLKLMAGIDIVRIPYKGGAANMVALLANEVQLSFSTSASVTPYMKSGRLKALAVTSAQPSALVPGLPTVAASGLPGFESGGLYGLFAPAKTPDAVIRRLSQEVTQIIRSPEGKEQFLRAGVEGMGSTPEELAATMKKEIARWGKVIKDAGIRAE